MLPHLRLSEIRNILRERDLILTKSLGQNFLHDSNQLARIVQLADIQPGDQVLEVGPGMGALTIPLLNAGAHVHAIEKDQRLVDFLTQFRIHKHPHFLLTTGDALEILKSAPMDLSNWKFVSNLPYSVGSPIVVELALSDNPPERLVITLQLEVIERAFATVDKPDYGLLSILIQLSFEPIDFFKLPSGCFFPPPDVVSACGLFRRRQQKLVDSTSELAHVRRLVKCAFHQRRKTLANSLKSLYDPHSVVAALAHLNHPPLQRPDKLSPQEFVSLTRLLGAPSQMPGSPTPLPG